MPFTYRVASSQQVLQIASDSGNYLIDFELCGEGEIVELAKSVRALITHIRQTVFGTQPVSNQRTGEATANEVYR
jgi:hypothetical protein